MAQRGWVWVLGVGLCGGLVPACTHTAGARLAGGVSTPVAADARPPASTAAVPGRTEPKADPPEKILKAGYPTTVPEIDLLPQTPPDVPPPAPPPPPPAEVKATPVAAPVPKDPPLVAALRCYLDKRPADAVAMLKGYDRRNQDLLLGLLPLAARLTEGALPREDRAVVVEQFDSLLSPLRSDAPLVLDRLCFCHDITMFGVYDPLPDDYVFQPGEYVHVYVELRNFTSVKRPRPDGQTDYVIDLVSMVEIRDVAGKVVKVLEPKRNGPNLSHTRRHDYYEGYHFCLPDLPQGLYTLWLRVVDRPTKREARRSLDFHAAAVRVRNQ